MTVDTSKLEQFVGKFVNDLGAAVHAGMVVIGDFRSPHESGGCIADA